MKQIMILWIILWAVCFTACKEDNLPTEGTQQAEDLELVISFNNEFEMGSRSALTSSEPTHHIEYMYAYVFANENSNDLTVEGATCIYEEKLPWEASAETQSVFRCKLKEEIYQTLTANNPEKKYLVMVVAVDNNKDTYTFPSTGTPSEDIHLGMVGAKLKNVKMALATGVDDSQMAYTEVFAGFRQFTTKQSQVQVTLTRRVAGVLCYLTDLPAKVNDYYIIGVQLHWSTGLNTEGILKPGNLTEGKESFADSELSDKLPSTTTLLAEVDLKEMGAEESLDGSTLYIPPVSVEGTLETLTNSVLMGAYMLPIQAEGHFVIKLVGEKREVDGTPTSDPVHVFTETESEGCFAVKQLAEDGTLVENYGITADYIYNIGYKPYSADTDYDDPLSLKGTEFKVVASLWDSHDIYVDFPNTQLGIVLSTDKKAGYRHDCVAGTDDIKVEALTEDYKDKPWTLTITYPDDDKGGWCSFSENSAETLTGVGDKDITINFNEYVDPHSKKIENPDEDYREATITLQVDNTAISSSIKVRQWNALIVNSVKENGDNAGKRAFRRLDNGAVFKPDGTVDYSNVKIYQWAEKNRLPSYIYGTDSQNTGDYGLQNYNNILDVKEWSGNQDHWDGCVVNLAKEGDWYLPARIELHALMYAMKNVSSAYLSDDINWWTSTARAASASKRYFSNKSVSVTKLKDLKDLKEGYYEDRKNYYRARLCKQIN